MKDLILAFCVLASFGAASETLKETQDRYCKVVFGDAAEAIMTAHQSGTPLSTVMGIMKGKNDRHIIEAAYAKPRYPTKEAQQQLIGEFRDDWHLVCLKVMASKQLDTPTGKADN